MANERKDIKYQIEHGYKLQTLMHKVNKETLIEQHRKQQKNKASGKSYIVIKGENTEHTMEGDSIMLTTMTESSPSGGRREMSVGCDDGNFSSPKERCGAAFPGWVPYFSNSLG